MTRLGISVEGATEREFVNNVLRPHLVNFGLTVTAIDLCGNVSLDKIRGILPALLGSFNKVSTLYDFYQFKGRKEMEILQLEAAIGALIDTNRRKRLIPYVQRYEFEALLFAVPQQAIELMGGSAVQLKEMEEAVRLSGSPELVNGSYETCPSRRMQKIFAGYDKKLHGPEIVKLAGLSAIRKVCPRFNIWVNRLENLATTL